MSEYVSPKKLVELIENYSAMVCECIMWIDLMLDTLGSTQDERVKKFRAIKGLSGDEVWELCQAYKEAKTQDQA